MTAPAPARAVSPAMPEVELSIEGIDREHCADAVTSGLGVRGGGFAVSVDLVPGCCRISSR